MGNCVTYVINKHIEKQKSQNRSLRDTRDDDNNNNNNIIVDYSICKYNIKYYIFTYYMIYNK
jgi:hypothetical protein